MSYKSLISDKPALFDWIIEHKDTHGILHQSLPDEASISLAVPELKDMHFVDGMIDGILGGESDEKKANDLFTLFQEFAAFSELSDEIIDEYLGKIYMFAISNITTTYIDSFLLLFLDSIKEKNGKGLIRISVALANQFVKTAVHREAVKFGIALLGIFKYDEAELEIFTTLGLADEFGKFVAIVLSYGEHNEALFDLAQKTEGWGRIAYFRYLEIDSEQKREWLIFEGYKCKIGIDYVVLACLEKGRVLEFAQERGIDSKLYDALGDMIDSIHDSARVEFSDYAHSKELVMLFVQATQTQKMNLKRFAILCNLLDFIHTEVFTLAEQEEMKDILKAIAFESGIDWEGLVRENPLDYYARIIAKTMGIDTWEDMFAIAKKQKHFDDWFALSLTDDRVRYAKICDLARSRYDLDALKSAPRDELGLGDEFSAYSDLEFIGQGLGRFEFSVDEIKNEQILGLDILQTLLQSPVTRSRNIALNVIESWLTTPQSIITLIEKNYHKEPNEDVKARYSALLKRHKEKAHYVIKPHAFRGGLDENSEQQEDKD